MQKGYRVIGFGVYRVWGLGLREHMGALGLGLSINLIIP